MSAYRDADGSDFNPHKELLAEAAAQVRADTFAREQARPKNVGQGTMSLVGDSLGGVALGAAALVMGPVQGYKKSGPKGILGGALGGLAIGVASTTIGIGSGIAKFADGASKTAESFNSRDIDPTFRVVDADRPAKGVYEREREAYSRLLHDEYNTAHANASTDGLTPPVENKLYDVLGVSVDAPPTQIRKAYYRLAQRYHPDKHPDDPTATAKFQEISDAYQVLSDPVKREEYHRLGEAATNGESMMDPKALFALMFSDFEHLVGDLATATILSTMGAAETGDGAEPNAQAMEARKRKKMEFQTMREEYLAKLLEQRLQPWINGQESAFIAHAKHEVVALREEPFGRDLLKTVAYVYKKKSSKFMESKGAFKGVQHFFDDLGEKAHSFKTQVRALEGGVKAMTASTNPMEDESIDETARREAVSTVGAVWLASVIDIERTLKGVLNTVLPIEQRKHPVVVRKAHGIFALGQIFEQA